MFIFIDWQTTLECALCALVFASLLTLSLFKPLGVLQSCGYKNGELNKWAGRKSNLIIHRFALLAFASVLCCAVFGLCFSFVGVKYASTVSLASYIIFFALYINADVRYPFRGGAQLTKRFKRLLTTVWLTFAVLIYFAATSLNFADYVWGKPIFSYLKYCALAIFPLLALYIAQLANLITLLWEKPINASYVKRAAKKLKEADITIVGITGSFAKTSCKNILNGMLAKKYTTLATPASYNTPLGIAKCVNENELPSGGVFIAEMGARSVGDVAELCKLCPPDWSMITGICPQHLQSFKSIEAIVETKGEIIGATKKSCFVAGQAFGYFNGRDKVVESNCVSDVVADCTGTQFTLTLGGKSMPIKTKLLGEHNAANIGLCASLAYTMGVGIEDVAEAIGELEFTEHRLQLLESNGISVLDDGYNCNVQGAKEALKVLHTFAGKKICVTPGIVELGILEESENALLGKELVGLDYVILVGETLVQCVKNGYTEGGGDLSKLTVVPTLQAAQGVLADMLAAGDCVLFLNDIPERYL